jgi:hypothetical protein
MEHPSTWQTYEEVARQLLDRIAEELGLARVEGKQYVPGRKSGATWEIDAKGISADGTGFVVIEIRRRTTSRLPQESVAAIAYRIDDTGAQGGIVVSPLTLQSGARKVAEAAGVIEVQLNQNSTTEQFVLRFLQKVMVGIPTDSLAVSALIVGIELTAAVPTNGPTRSDA